MLTLFFGVDGRIAPRSGLASKHMIDTGAGVIDADYRGQVKVLLFIMRRRILKLKRETVLHNWFWKGFIHLKSSRFRSWKRVLEARVDLEAPVLGLLL